MRLIDADALNEKIEELIGYSLSYEAILNAIDNAETIIPFASVETQTMIEYERPQGKWLNNRVAFCFTCDYCGCNISMLKNIVFEGDYDYNFCPNCGADMQKGGAE